MKSLFRGKYEKKIYITFLSVFALLICAFMLLITNTMYQQTRNVRERTLLHGMELDWKGVQLKLGLLSKEIERVIESSSTQKFADATSENLQRFYAIQVQRELQIAVNRMNGISFNVAMLRLDNPDFIITPISSENRDLFFRDTIPMHNSQLQDIFKTFSQDSVYTKTALGGGSLPMIVHFERDRFYKSPILLVVGIPIDELLLPSFDYRWGLSRGDKILGWSGFSLEEIVGLETLLSSNNEKSTIYKYPLESMGWTLFIEHIDQKIPWYSFIIQLMLPYLLSVLLSLVIAWFLTRLLYRPIGELIEEVNTTNEKVYDEFSLLKKRTSRVRELNQLLQNTMVERDALLQQRIHRDLLFGVKSPLKDKDRPTKKMKNETNEKVFYGVALFEFQNNTFDEIQDFRLYKGAIAEYAHREGSLRYANLSISTCAVIMRVQSIDSAQGIAQEILSIIDITENDIVQVALSTPRIGEDSLHISYEECRKILEYRFLLRNRVILRQDQVEEISQSSCYYPLWLENQLIHYIVQGDSRCVSLYKKILHENDGSEVTFTRVRKSLVISLVGTLNRVVQELKTIPPKLLLEEYRFEILVNRWKDENIFDKIAQSFNIITDYVQQEKDRHDSELSVSLLRFIHENYHTDIMLIDLAEQLNVSEKYCGILFKQRTGENFKIYLNQYRIQQAQELLQKHPHIKIADLAIKVGFNSSNTFIRVFSKLVGVTPKQYGDSFRDK